jgi:hypothetical protein
MTARAALACLLAASISGCASGPGPDSPRRVAVLLAQDASAIQRDRQVMRRLLGRDALSAGELMKETILEELRSRGYDPSAATTGTTEQEELEAARAASQDALLVIEVGAWDLDAVPSTNQATVDYALRLLKTSDGVVTWSETVKRRTIALRTGEPRDMESLVRRLVLQALRSFP